MMTKIHACPTEIHGCPGAGNWSQAILLVSIVTLSVAPSAPAQRLRLDTNVPRNGRVRGIESRGSGLDIQETQESAAQSAGNSVPAGDARPSFASDPEFARGSEDEAKFHVHLITSPHGTKRGGIVYHSGKSRDGTEFELKCDVYTPVSDGPHPTILCVHGGGWWIGGQMAHGSSLLEVRGSRICRCGNQLSPCSRVQISLPGSRCESRRTLDAGPCG